MILFFVQAAGALSINISKSSLEFNLFIFEKINSIEN